LDNLAIIGGTGLDSLGILEVDKREIVETPYGPPSGVVTRGSLFGKEVFFLPRHGYSHTVPPHQINYRANLWALRELGAKSILAIAAVGGIHKNMSPARLAIPDQLIDYTWGRAGTFYEGENEEVIHIDFTNPYCEQLRGQLLSSASSAGLEIIDGGTYGVTQGPRLETAAEIKRMEQDGCDMVGMTGMPEAALARELDLCYATCAVIANWAAGKFGGIITMAEIEENLKKGLLDLGRLLEALMHTGGINA
jgi:5'-methylthioinosine phosphorylase